MKKRYSLTFDIIDELVSKVEKIKAAAPLDYEISAEKLTIAGIRFKKLGEYGCLIDMADLNPRQMAVVESLNTNCKLAVFKELGVIEEGKE